MAQLRITGGKLRGRRLAAPAKGETTRPTSERLRETVFSILGDVEGAWVLDLFCAPGRWGSRRPRAGPASPPLVRMD